jgi:hypothetical protein
MERDGSMTTIPTREEIAELVEFCRNERDAREFSRVENDYVTTARSALAIAEKLPALLAERETLKTAEPSYGSVMAAIAYYNHLSGSGHFHLPPKFNWYECIGAAYSIDIAPLIAERGRLAADVARLSVALGKERGEVERLNEDLDRANYAVRRIGMSLGSSDEWTDQATMIADVEGRVAAARETIAKLREALAPFAAQPLSTEPQIITLEYLSPAASLMKQADKIRELDDRIMAARAALAQLDAAPTPGHTDLMISPEAIDEALAANPLPEELANPGEDSRLAQAERAVAEAVEIMRPVSEVEIWRDIYPDGPDIMNGEFHADPEFVRAARLFVEKHGGAK